MRAESGKAVVNKRLRALSHGAQLQLTCAPGNASQVLLDLHLRVVEVSPYIYIFANKSPNSKTIMHHWRPHEDQIEHIYDIDQLMVTHWRLPFYHL